MQQILFKKTEPLFKWPGGKRKLLKHLLPLIPASFNTYYEPFMGGGALFFALQPEVGILSDTNDELINCYTQVRDVPDRVLGCLSTMENNKEDYYRIRKEPPTDNVARAARMIYLCTHSFNGIHRVNLSGIFNVPYGNNPTLKHYDPDRLHSTSKALSSTRLVCRDFEDVLAGAKVGDFIYLDPPYTVAHNNNGFVKYNATIFSWEDQMRLAEVAKELDQRGCKVLISNADHESVRSLYIDFTMGIISRTSTIAASGLHRPTITECVFYNYEQE